MSMPSAEDHRRLLRDYVDATEQFKATNEVLSALGRSSSDPDAVLDTVVESARRLCRSEVAAIYLIEDGTFRLASSVGLSPEFVRNVTDFPMEVNRGTVIGRAAVERRVQKVPDVLTDTEFVRIDVQQKGGIRSSMSAPMLLDGEVVGGLSVYRTEVDPFDEREEALLEGFAAQAAVVVRNVHLVRALEDRSAELARRVEQMEALSEVGQTVGSSLVLDEVLSNIIKNAVRFAGCDGGSMMEYLEGERSFWVRSAYAEQSRAAGPAPHHTHRAGHDTGRPCSPRGSCSIRYPISRWSISTRICSCCTTTAGDPSWLYPCFAANALLAPWSFVAAHPESSPRRQRNSYRHSPASRRWRSTTRSSSTSSKRRAPNWR